MAYLVIDLQKSSLDSQISTINLLRKALVVAKKLKLNDFENWINFEMNGYKNIDDIPEYRKVYGQLKGWNPFNGWIPTLIDCDAEMQNMLTTRKITDSISELEFLMQNEGDSLCVNYPGNMEATLGKLFGFETKYQLFVNKSQFQGILETVRTTVMKWALELECDGILGEEMLFNNREKEIAIHKNYTVNNFYGNIDNSQIQQNTNKSIQKNNS